MAEGARFCAFGRDGCVAMVARSAGQQGFAGIGSSGLALDQGLGYLVWRDEKPLLVGHGFEAPARPDQVAAIQRFSSDLKSALGLS